MGEIPSQPTEKPAIDMTALDPQRPHQSSLNFCAFRGTLRWKGISLVNSCPYSHYLYPGYLLSFLHHVLGQLRTVLAGGGSRVLSSKLRRKIPQAPRRRRVAITFTCKCRKSIVLLQPRALMFGPNSARTEAMLIGHAKRWQHAARLSSRPLPRQSSRA